MTDNNFNPAPPSVLHIDFNSCFASIEQQANPLFRGQPLVVAAYATGSGCILAASREAKAQGHIKTGMLVREAKKIIPNLIVLEPDSMKYRQAHLGLKKILKNYSPEVEPKSIDEFVCHFDSFKPLPSLLSIAKNIKQDIKNQLGDWLTVSIGLGPNRFLAKQAAIFKKPDGLETIDSHNFLNYYQQLKLTDLNGISWQNEKRLNRTGIYSVLDMYHSPVYLLKKAFHGICGYYWYLRLHGYEIDRVSHHRRSFSAIYSLPHPATGYQTTSGILTKLVEKTALNLLQAGYSARSLSLYLKCQQSSWHCPKTLPIFVSDLPSIVSQANHLLQKYSFNSPIKKICFTLFNLQPVQSFQSDLFDTKQRSVYLNQALLNIKKKYGIYGIIPATMLKTQDQYKDFIGFGNVKGIENLFSSESSSKE